MITKKMLYLFAVLLCIYAPVTAFAQERNIYPGDIITLEISSPKFSENELREKFQDFEIIKIKSEADGYLLSIRTFDTGKKTILLGNKEVIIDVCSTLTDIDREDIFEGDTEIISASFSFHLRLIFYFAAIIFVLSIGFFIAKILKKRKTKPESAYQLFMRLATSLSADSDNYFVDLTLYFKVYIESLYNLRIIGKTSAEIANELKEIQRLNSMLPEIKKWLTDCDMLKFAGINASSDEKRRHYEWLLSIVKKIDANQSNINEGMS